MNGFTLATIISLLILGVSESATGSAKTPTLEVSVSNTITEPFLVDEKGIRKLREILDKRAQEICAHRKIIYTARFLDNTSYETDDIETILKEGNRPPQQIQYISMRVHTLSGCPSEPIYENYGTPIIEVAASTRSFDHGLSYAVVGRSRDWVFLTQSDVSKHMESMTISYVLPRLVWAMLVWLLIVIVCFLCIVIPLHRSYSRGLSAKGSLSKPISIGEFVTADHAFLQGLMIISFSASVFVGYFLNEQLAALWPTGVFLIGDEIKRNESIASFRHGVGLFILTAIILPFIGKRFVQMLRWIRLKTFLT